VSNQPTPGNLLQCPHHRHTKEAPVATPTEHRTKAEELLAQARTYGPSAAARLSTLAEAQVHATLYLADLTAAIAAPQRIVVNQTLPAGDFKPSPAPIVAAEDTTDGTPAPKRRTRKATTAKETDK
jgi:hypothetical protein